MPGKMIWPGVMWSDVSSGWLVEVTTVCKSTERLECMLRNIQRGRRI